MPHKSDFRNRHVKNVLRETMMTLLEKQDFDQITVNEICMEAAMSRTTFYQHYQDKFDLLVDCVTVISLPAPGQLEQDDLEGYFENVFAANIHHSKAIRRLYQYEGGRELQIRTDESMVKIYLQYYQHQEKLGRRFDVPVEVLAEYMCNGINSVIKLWFRNDRQPPEEEIIRFFARTMRESVECNSSPSNDPLTIS